MQVGTQFRLLSKTLNITAALEADSSDSEEEMMYEIGLDNYESMVLRTQTTTTINQMQQVFRIGRSRFWNEGQHADSNTRQKITTYRTEGTDLSLNVLPPGADIVG